MATADAGWRFPYYSESSRRTFLVADTAVILFCILAVLALIPLFRLVMLAFAAGPALWLALEGLRRGRGITLAGDHVQIQHPITGRVRQFAYVDILAFALTPGGGLALAYRKAPAETLEATPLATGGKLSLTQARPSASPKARPALVVTTRLADPRGLAEALSQRVSPSTALEAPISPDLLLVWVRRRRWRNRILWLILFLCTPLFALVLIQIIFSFMRMGGTTFGR